MIFGSLYHMKRLSAAFEEAKSKQVYSGKERIDLILLMLINEDDYIKAKALAIDLNTSAQTIRNDYIALKEKIRTHDVIFETKKSYGVRLVGNEIQKRHPLIEHQKNILQVNVSLEYQDYEQEFQTDILKILNDNFGLTLYDSEKDYFQWMIHLYVGRTHYDLHHQVSVFQNPDKISCLIGDVEAKFHFPFRHDKNLTENLLLYISMAMERIQSGINVTNSMLDEITNFTLLLR